MLAVLMKNEQVVQKINQIVWEKKMKLMLTKKNATEKRSQAYWNTFTIGMYTEGMPCRRFGLIKYHLIANFHYLT